MDGDGIAARDDSEEVSVTAEQIRSFGTTYLKPLMAMALQTMPAKMFVHIMMGYVIGAARGAGLDEAELRAAFEGALSAVRPD